MQAVCWIKCTCLTVHAERIKPHAYSSARVMIQAKKQSSHQGLRMRIFDHSSSRVRTARGSTASEPLYEPVYHGNGRLVYRPRLLLLVSAANQLSFSQSGNKLRAVGLRPGLGRNGHNSS